jgi:hypothetical protein
MCLVLNSVYRDAIKKREEARSIFKGEKFDQIIKTATENWIEYVPQKKNSDIAGIDSTYNSTKFQGLELWVVTGVSIKSDGQIITEIHNQGLGQPVPELETQASKMEVESCINSIDKADLVVLDGSLYSQFLTRQAILGNSLIAAIKKRNNVIFISKTSSARKQFEKLGSVAGDIFYYNHAVKTPGFSKIFVDTSLGPGKVISYVYARLRDSTPLIKIELLGSNHDEKEVKLLLDMITKNSVGGYPYSLKLAHENFKTTNTDLSRLVSLYGLGNEVGSREVLN